ncbi:MAG: bacillithiol biosynthesis deacetylase BshB1 [Bacteroidetes bacterium]|nr:MAG: bacillithiol biosynthesis deacetylase BshB1 [Bacteroidota bacterium]
MTARASARQLDVIAFGAHPDDVEIFAGGIVCTMTAAGYKVGVVDLTAGELGTRGSKKVRRMEAAAAAKIMGISVRENLELPDGNIERTVPNRNVVVRVLRTFRPEIILIPAPDCRHPDHPDAAQLITDAVFHAGLSKVGVRSLDGVDLEPFRPDHVLHYMQSIPFEPSIVVDVSATWEQRMQAINAYGSQVHNPDYDADNNEPKTFVSDPGFIKWIEARARAFGYRIGAEYGEPLLYRHGPIGTADLVRMLRS